MHSPNRNPDESWAKTNYQKDSRLAKHVEQNVHLIKVERRKIALEQQQEEVIKKSFILIRKNSWILFTDIKDTKELLKKPHLGAEVFMFPKP